MGNGNLRNKIYLKYSFNSSGILGRLSNEFKRILDFGNKMTYAVKKINLKSTIKDLLRKYHNSKSPLNGAITLL